MKNLSLKVFLRSRYPLAMLAGFLLACAFPNLDVAGFGWIAPGLILGIALGTSGKQSFRIGYAAGLVHYLTSLYWLLCIPVRGFPILGWIALSAFLALYPAVWVWIAIRISGIRLPSQNSTWPDFRVSMAAMAERSWTQRTLWAVTCAALWVAWEMMIARFLGGFPWNLLGASQFRMVPLIQIASFTGVYGISFLLVWSSVSLLNASLAIARKPQLRSAWISEIALPLLAISVSFAFGFHQLRNAAAPQRELKVTLLQPSIPQTMIWDPEASLQRFQTLIRLSETALTHQTDLLIWPEAAIPRMLRYAREVQEPILSLAREHRVWMIVGSDDGEPRRNSNDPDAADYFNSSFLISSSGKIVNNYRKRSLVIFGEYIPLERWLPFIKWFTPIESGFTPGDKAVPFEMDFALQETPSGLESIGETNINNSALAPLVESPSNLAVKTAVLICFEDNFPHLVREYVDEDTDFLVNITNNGWFGESAAQWQHGANAIFRAIENGLPLVRCSNNGLTCWVDAHGRIRDFFRDDSGTIYGPGFLTINVPLLNPGERREPTFYRQHGDWFGWSCVAISVLAVFRAWFRSRESDKYLGAKE